MKCVYSTAEASTSCDLPRSAMLINFCYTLRKCRPIPCEWHQRLPLVIPFRPLVSPGNIHGRGEGEFFVGLVHVRFHLDPLPATSFVLIFFGGPRCHLRLTTSRPPTTTRLCIFQIDSSWVCSTINVHRQHRGILGRTIARDEDSVAQRCSSKKKSKNKK